jgi:predicted permease
MMALAPWANAFVPVFGLLALGALLRRRLLPDDTVWAGIERLIFWVLLPCLIASALSSVRFGDLPVARMAGSVWASLALGTLASVALARALGCSHAAMTSVLQGGIRFNTLMGLAVGGAIWGAPGLALAAIATGLIVPVVQIVVTIAFALGRDGGHVRPLALLRQVALNPLIIGVVAGFALSAMGGLPPGLQPAVHSLGQASVALGLLCIGAALTLEGLGDRLGTQAATAFLKLVVMPALTWTCCSVLGLGDLATAVLVTFTALPTAPTSYVMARAMGGDARLMAAITTSEHLLSVLTLPVWVWLVVR